MHRFFVEKEDIPNIRGSDFHQVRDVLRMKAGDDLELLDGSGRTYTARIAAIKKDHAACEVLSVREERSDLPVKVTIAQCLPKGRKMDQVVQKCTELGAHGIIPVLSERAVARAEKPERWKKIAKEAAEQCGRSALPEISSLIRLDEFLKTKGEFDLALIPWELEGQRTIKQALSGNQAKSILVLIGPEGGFSQPEVELAKNAGLTPVSLGRRILRTETAAMAILAMINYEHS